MQKNLVCLGVLSIAGITAGITTRPFAIAQTSDHHATKKSTQPAASDAAATRLPVTRVLLYKSGVGFFEHAGTVHGNQPVVIDFTSAQLNDVLQSLTVLDLNGGHITGADYSSTTPLEQQLKTLSLGLGPDPTTDQFYTAIRGARVQVRTGTSTFTGRLLNVELQNADSDNKNAPVVQKRYITVVSEAGAAQTIELTSKTQVVLLDTELHQDVTRYLELLASTRAQGLRHLTLQAVGSGTRQIRVSYIGEVPIWKATYRILFNNEAKPDAATESATMQGWAVVDNTTGNDWSNVQMSLIAGAPQSFIQPISQPYYSRRPEIGLPEEAQLTPQTHESGDTPPPPPPIVKAGAPRELHGDYGSGNGYGSGAGGSVGGGNYHVGGSSETVSVATQPIDYEDSAASSIVPDSKGSAFDDYFEYALSSPVTLHRNESALVPILQAKVEAQRVTLWSPTQSTALRALWLTNTSDQTLDRGSFSIVEDGKFGGEGLLDPIHPHEKRLLSYAADQAVRVTTDYQHDTRRTQQISVSKGILTEKTLEISEEEYLVHNAATQTRDVIVEQPKRQGWSLDSDPQPVETTSNAYRFNVITRAGETVRLHIGERHTISQRYELTNMSDQQIDYMIRSTGDEAQLRQQLAPILDVERKLADIDAQLATATKSIEDIGKDQKRLRENLAALKDSPEERALVRRYTDELNTQEDRISALRKRQQDLQLQRSAAEQDLAGKVQTLQIGQALSD